MSAGIKSGSSIILLCFCIVCAGAEDDYRTRVAVVPMTNHTGDPVNDSVCRTVTDTVALVLRLLGSYAVTESYDEPALAGVDTSSMPALSAFAEEKRFDELIFGEARKGEGAYLALSLRLYSRSAQGVKYQEEAIADTLFDVFDAADAISIGLISQFSDIHIGFGKIEVRRGSGTGTYQVYVNDNRIRYPETGLSKVLNGTYTLSVRQDRLLGLTEIYREQIEVYEDKSTIVSFHIPTATPEELAYLDSLTKKVESAADTPEGLEELLGELADFQAVAASIDYDGALIERCARTVKEAGERASAQLERAIADADGQYFARRPRFDDALATYDRLSSLLNDTYGSSVVRADPNWVNPIRAVPSPDGGFYVLDSAPELTLRRVEEGRATSSSTLPYASDDAANPAIAEGMAVDPEGDLCFAHPSSSEILLYDSSLTPKKSVTIPGYVAGSAPALRLAISSEGTFYLFAGEEVAVFEPAKERQQNVEAAILASEKDVAWGSATQCFFDHQSRLVLYDSSSGRILRLDYLGNLISEARLPEAFPGSRIAVDKLGYFYLTADGAHEIRKYSPEGEYLTAIGRYGANPGEFAMPRGAAALADGTLLVCDSANSRVQVLSPTSTPVLLPQVVRFGDRVAAREQTARQAVRKMEIVSRDIRPLKTISRFAGTFASIGAAAGLAIAAGLFAQVADARYEEYQAATDVEEVARLHAETQGAWNTARGLVAGMYGAIGLGSVLFATTLIATADEATARERAIRYLQVSALDASYAIDPTRYRSLRAAQRLGALTGILPAALGGSIGLAALAFPDLLYRSVTAYGCLGLIAIPPIWAHLYGGRFHVPLLLTGLVADAAVGAALLIETAHLGDWEPSSLGISTGNAAFDEFAKQAWRVVQTEAPVLLMVAGVGIRLTAGIYDTTRGWRQAKDYNTYRAVRKAESPVSFRLSPTLERGSPGVSLAVAY